jgi:hypothetical protein
MEYLFLIQLLKMHFTIIIIIVFLVTSKFLGLRGLRPVLYISRGLSLLQPPPPISIYATNTNAEYKIVCFLSHTICPH